MVHLELEGIAETPQPQTAAHTKAINTKTNYLLFLLRFLRFAVRCSCVCA